MKVTSAATDIFCPTDDRNTNTTSSNTNHTGGIAMQGRKISKRKEVENEEIRMYLGKLKDLVPFMPRDRKLSKLEVIQRVIDYICDLQNALETHPAITGGGGGPPSPHMVAHHGSGVTPLGVNNRGPLSNDTGSTTAPPGHRREPLGLRISPNTILLPPLCEPSSMSPTVSFTSSEKCDQMVSTSSC